MKVLDTIKSVSVTELMWLLVIIVVANAALPKLIDLAIGIGTAIKSGVFGG